MKLSFAKPSAVKEQARRAAPMAEIPTKVPMKRLAARVLVHEKKAFESLCRLTGTPMTVTVGLLLEAWREGTIAVPMHRQTHAMADCERLVLDVPEDIYRMYKGKAAGMGLTLTDVVCCLVRANEVVLGMMKSVKTENAGKINQSFLTSTHLG